MHFHNTWAVVHCSLRNKSTVLVDAQPQNPISLALPDDDCEAELPMFKENDLINKAVLSSEDYVSVKLGRSDEQDATTTVSTDQLSATQVITTTGHFLASSVAQNGRVNSLANDENSQNNLVMLMKTGHVILEYHMRSVTTDQAWLEVEVIHAFLSCYRSKSFLVLSSSQWELIEKGQLPEILSGVNWKTVKNIVVGRHEPGHFVLIWINVEKAKVAYINTIQQAYDYDNKLQCIVKIWNNLCHSTVLSGNLTKSFSSCKPKYLY